MRSLLLAVICAMGLSTAAQADTQGTPIFKVQLSFSTYTLVGYTDSTDPKRPDPLGDLKAQKRIYFIEGIRETRFLESAPLLITTKKPYRVDATALVSVEFLKGDFDGRFLGDGGITVVPVRVAELLTSRPPVYHCVAQYVDIPEHHWISWNPRVGKNELQPLCDRSFQNKPSVEERRSILKQKDVYDVMVMSD